MSAVVEQMEGGIIISKGKKGDIGWGVVFGFMGKKDSGSAGSPAALSKSNETKLVARNTALPQALEVKKIHLKLHTVSFAPDQAVSEMFLTCRNRSNLEQCCG